MVTGREILEHDGVPQNADVETKGQNRLLEQAMQEMDQLPAAKGASRPALELLGFPSVTFEDSSLVSVEIDGNNGDRAAEIIDQAPENFDFEDNSGRPESEGHRERIEQMFRPLSREEHQRSRELVEKELSQFRASDGGNVLEHLKNSGLRPDQVDRVLNVLAEVRENYARQTANGTIKPEQKGSWFHSIGELAEVIDVAKANKLRPTQLQNAIFAAAFTDGVKSGWSKEFGGNFFTHHLDGALAADVVLSRWTGKEFTEEDREAVRHAILEHQISPPKFMGQQYAKQVFDGINNERQNEFKELSAKNQTGSLATEAEKSRFAELSKQNKAFDDRAAKLKEMVAAQNSEMGLPTLEREAEIQELEKLQKFGRFVTSEEGARISGIEKAISDPLNSPVEDDPRGGKRLVFDAEQRALLSKYVGSGTENWHVPHKDNPWAKESSTVIAADALDNYFGQTNGKGEFIKGPNKIISLRGPLSGLPDADIHEAIQSVQSSEDSSKELMNEAERELADRRSQQSNEVYRQALNSTEEFIRQRLNLGPNSTLPKIPYWNEKLELLGPQASAEDKKAFAERPEVKFANEIHQHFASELLKMRQVNQSEKPPEIVSVRGAKPNEGAPKPIETAPKPSVQEVRSNETQPGLQENPVAKDVAQPEVKRALNSERLSEVRQFKVNGHDVTVESLPDYQKKGSPLTYSDRVVTIDGKPIKLQASQQSWFYSRSADTKADSAEMPKIHIKVDGPGDLARVQASILPVLEQLIDEKKIKVYKTYDPNFADKEWSSTTEKPAPGTHFQSAKGFTVYVPKEHALEVAAILEKTLVGQQLKQPFEPNGSVGDLWRKNSESGRVSLERANWEFVEPAPNSNRISHLVDPAVEKAISKKFAQFRDRNGKMTPEGIEAIEKAAGIEPGKLHVEPTTGRIALISRHSRGEKGSSYLDESSADSREGSRTGRPAMYALHELAKVDPVLAELAPNQDRPAREIAKLSTPQRMEAAKEAVVVQMLDVLEVTYQKHLSARDEASRKQSGEMLEALKSSEDPEVRKYAGQLEQAMAEADRAKSRGEAPRPFKDVIADKRFEFDKVGSGRRITLGVGFGVGAGTLLGAYLSWQGSGKKEPAPLRESTPKVERRN